MKYKKIVEGKFITRINRFTATVDISGKLETVHVKNTGRCKEIFVPGNTVYLSVSDNPERKTKYDLVTVEKKRGDKAPLFVNVDSQIPNDVVGEWLPQSGLFEKGAVIKREVFYNKSRFDFMIDEDGVITFLEVKGVTLEDDGAARFPDAPTQRGVKHIGELIDCVENGYKAVIVFVLQMKGVSFFTPNDATHAEFGDALRKAYTKGVKIFAIDCTISPDSIIADKYIPVVL